jgi:hypothetical protein
VTIVFKELHKLVSHSQQEKTHINSYLRGYKTNHFGFGILSSTNSRISEQTEIAALTTLLVYQLKMQLINLFMTTRKLYLIVWLL